jgi:hypothetical protein
MAATREAAGFRSHIVQAGERFNAWWEGYAYTPAEPVPTHATPVDVDIAEAIWGHGRTEPGDVAWTMRHARALGLATKAEVAVFGAGLGAPIKDLKIGTRWKACGFTRTPRRIAGNTLSSYEQALTRLSRKTADGGLCFFELHRDADPAGFARLAGEHIKPGAPLAFIDFATARKAVRMPSCFPAEASGAPRLAADYARLIKEAGFLVGDTIDESRGYTPLIARGWKEWRRVYETARAARDARERSEKLRFLAAYAQLWAERLDALRSGQLQVVRIQARKAA